MTTVVVGDRRGGSRREEACEDEAEIGVIGHKLRDAWSLWGLEEARWDSFSELLEGSWPGWHLDFELLASRTMGESTSVVLSSPVGGNKVPPRQP